MVRRFAAADKSDSELWAFNLRHLSAISKIAELGTVRAAAHAVNLTQPALTQALLRIEHTIGLRLFERRYEGMVPTDAADLLLPRLRAASEHIGNQQVTMARMRALLTLAEFGSYKGAAMVTGLSGRSLQRAIADLSLSLRRRLVERRDNAVVLTEAGASLVRAFHLARLELQTGFAELEALKGQDKERVVVGALPLSQAKLLPAAVARFSKRHEQVQITIVEASRPELIEILRNGGIDIIVGAVSEPPVEPDLVQEELFRDRLSVIARKGHPLEAEYTGRGTPAVEALQAYPWVIAPRGAPLRRTWEQMFASAGLEPPQVPIECSSLTTIRQLLAGGDFLTLLSLDQLSVELQAGWLISVGHALRGQQRTIGVTSRASWRPTFLQTQFIDELRRAAG